MVTQILVKNLANTAFVKVNCELATQLNCTDFAAWCLYPLQIIRRTCWKWTCSWFTFLYWSFLHHFDTHNSRLTQQGASSLWNCWQKPCCVAVTDSVLINISTAGIRCCTDHHSISTKLQTSLYIMTVSTKAASSWHTGFQISKTVRCFWCTLYIYCVTR